MKKNTINIESGLEPIELVFSDRSETETIYFNPTDMNLVIRLKNSEANITKAFDEYKAEKESGKLADEADEIAKLNAIVCGEVDEIFDSRISDKVFKYCSPFSANEKGMTYIERFFNAVKPIIENAVIQSRRASEERIKKHTGKYDK